MSIKFKNKLFSIIKKIPTEIFIFTFAVLYRLPSLGYDFVNNDAYLWKERGYAFGAALVGLDPAATAVTYHPGVPLLWSQFIAIKVFSLLDMLYFKGSLVGKELFLVNHSIQKLVLVFLTSILITLVYNTLKRVVGRFAAFIAILLVMFEPFFIGLSRAVHTDVLLSLFMFLSFLYFYLGQRNSKSVIKNWYLIFSGIFAGLSVLTKSSGIFILLFLGLTTIVFWISNRNKRSLEMFCYVIGIAIITFFVLWPSMWVQPLQSLDLYLNKGVQGVALEEGHGHIWFGEETQDPGIAFYPVVFFARYTAFLVIMFLAGSGYLLYRSFYKKNISKRDLRFILLNLLFVLFYAVMITLVSKKLDRYSLPIIFPIVTIISIYIVKAFSRKLIIGMLFVLVIYRSLLLYGLHPDYLGYYSPLVGGIEYGRYVVEPKWLVGYKGIADYFNEIQEKSDDEIKVAIADYDYLEPFAKFEVLNIKHEVERDEADYFVLPIHRTQRNLFYRTKYELERIDTIDIAGVEFYRIYINHGQKN